MMKQLTTLTMKALKSSQEELEATVQTSSESLQEEQTRIDTKLGELEQKLDYLISLQLQANIQTQVWEWVLVHTPLLLRNWELICIPSPYAALYSCCDTRPAKDRC